MFIGGVCLTISCVTSAFVENIDELILTYGVIGGNFKLLFLEPVHENSNNVVCATSKASDQHSHTRSLIKHFARRFSILCLLSY